MPVILGGVESKLLGFVYVFGGLWLFGFSLAFLEMYISKRKRPELIRKQRIEARDERNTLVRDKAGAKTLNYLLFMILISTVVYMWFDIPVEYVNLVWWILLTSCVLYFAHLYYYKQRL